VARIREIRKEGAYEVWKMSNPHTAAKQHPERLPVFSKRTSQLLFRVSKEHVFAWNKVTKDWEEFTWEELLAMVGHGEEVSQPERVVV
jgi:hypothetical protein